LIGDVGRLFDRPFSSDMSSVYQSLMIYVNRMPTRDSLGSQTTRYEVIRNGSNLDDCLFSTLKANGGGMRRSREGRAFNNRETIRSRFVNFPTLPVLCALHDENMTMADEINGRNWNTIFIMPCI
jgi:hypothetical protein